MKLEIFPVTSSTWCFRRRSYLACSYMVRTVSGIVLLDAGMDSTGQDIELALKQAFGAAACDVKAILLTHWHNDHTAGAQALWKKSNAKIYYHAGDQDPLTRVNANSGLRSWFAERVPEWGPLVLLKGLLGECVPRAVVADHLVCGGEAVESDFEVIETPGHTPGHVSFYYKPERILFAGDALAVIHHQVRFMARAVTPDMPSARQSMMHCLNRPISHLCPGHRTPLSIDTQARCNEMLTHLRKGIQWPFLG